MIISRPRSAWGRRRKRRDAMHALFEYNTKNRKGERKKKIANLCKKPPSPIHSCLRRGRYACRFLAFRKKEKKKRNTMRLLSVLFPEDIPLLVMRMTSVGRRPHSFPSLSARLIFQGFHPEQR